MLSSPLEGEGRISTRGTSVRNSGEGWWLSHDIILDIGQPINVIPHLLRDLKEKKRSRNKSGMTLVSCHCEVPTARQHVRQYSCTLPCHCEGATHVDMSDNIRRVAFTLAEVLITLGIIGIVAAMTIPTLIANYQKKQTVSKLKQTYSIISQALTMAQAEHGDTTTWEVNGIYDTPTASPNFSKEDTIKNFVTKYFIPYLKVAKDYGYTQYTKIGYDGPFLPVSGNLKGGYSNYDYKIMLSNNVLVNVGLGTGCLDGEKNPDGTCVTQVYRNIIFGVDINGFDKPNVSGKDRFAMAFDVRKKVFGFHNYGSSRRQGVLNNCKTDDGSQLCGYLIFLDGWEIKDDYPWF